MFLKQSFMARKAEPSVPLSMVNARFYVADLPQQGSSPDCGLYIGEYMRKLMNGQHFEIKVKDVSYCMLFRLQCFSRQRI